MIRNLKVLLAAALALTALGAIAASAHAADEFHCSLAFATCRGKLSTDGTGTTAHQVFIIENKEKTESISLTCESLRGTAEFVSATDVTLGWTKGTTDREAYDGCKINGSPGGVVHMNSCKYTFTAGAGGTASPGTAELHIICEVGDVIEATVPNSTCVLRVGPQTLGGIGYHTIGTTPSREVTVTVNIKNAVISSKGSCESLIKPGQELVGTYTTGNTIVTAQTEAGVMAEAWFE